MALLGGMALATLLGVFLYPMLFVAIGKLFGYEKRREKGVVIQTAAGNNSLPDQINKK